MDDQQQLLVVIGAAVGGVLIGILVVLILDLPPGWATLAAVATGLVAARLVRRG